MTAEIVTIGGPALAAYGPVELTLARRAARRAVKAEWYAQGRRLHSISPREISCAALFYFYHHRRELLEQAAETARKSHTLRTLAEREAHTRQGNHR
jgi:hypothetical protein